MAGLELSDHFIERWAQYFNERPTIHRIIRIIKRSKWIQRQRLLFDERGRPYRQLATYWHPERNVIIKVDWTLNKVITVITPRTKGAKHERRDNHDQGAENKA